MTAVRACWAPGVYIPELSNRFWRLTLQIMSRYTSWLEKSVPALYSGEPVSCGTCPRLCQLQLKGHIGTNSSTRHQHAAPLTSPDPTHRRKAVQRFNQLVIPQRIQQQQQPRKTCCESPRSSSTTSACCSARSVIYGRARSSALWHKGSTRRERQSWNVS
jgi:hypothetical protein